MPLSVLVEKCGFFRMSAHETCFTFRIYWTYLSSGANDPVTLNGPLYCPLFVCFFSYLPPFKCRNCISHPTMWDHVSQLKEKYTHLEWRTLSQLTLLLWILFLMAPVFTFSLTCKPSYFPIKVIVPITKCILEMCKCITLYFHLKSG